MKEQDLLREGATWRFFSLLFRCPTKEAAKAARKLPDEVDPALRPAARPLAGEMAAAGTEWAYHDLLGSGGPVSSCESDYQVCGEEGMRDKGAVLGDVAGFYTAFGFPFREELPAAPDHAAVELAFLGFLKLKEAYAVMGGREGEADVCRRAAEGFLRDHLGVWMPSFLDAVLRRTEDSFHARAARALRGHLAEKGVFPACGCAVRQDGPKDTEGEMTDCCG